MSNADQPFGMILQLGCLWNNYQNRYLSLNSQQTPHTQCWKFPQVRRSEADNFGGGPGTFCWVFFNFMFMIWDSRHEDLQPFWPSFKHCPYLTLTSEKSLGSQPWDLPGQGWNHRKNIWNSKAYKIRLCWILLSFVLVTVQHCQFSIH